MHLVSNLRFPVLSVLRTVAPDKADTHAEFSSSTLDTLLEHALAHVQSPVAIAVLTTDV